MTRGRKPTPTPILKLRGSNAPSIKDRADEPKPDLAAPSCPSHLDKEGRAEFRRMVGHLRDLKVIARIDRNSLAIYCAAWSRWVAAEKELKTTGGPVVKSPSGYPIENPWAKVSRDAQATLIKLLPEFGLSPSSRTRLRVTKPKKEAAAADPFKLPAKKKA